MHSLETIKRLNRADPYDYNQITLDTFIRGAVNQHYYSGKCLHCDRDIALLTLFGVYFHLGGDHYCDGGRVLRATPNVRGVQS